MTAKKRLIKISLISYLLFHLMLFFSCASGRIIGDAAQLHIGDIDTATVTILRLSEFLGSGVKSEVYLDNEKIAHLGAGDFVKLHLRPGAHFVAARFAKDENVVRIFAESNENYYFFLGASTGFIMEQHTEEEFQDELSKDNYKDIASER